FGSLSRAKSTREAGSTASTSSARGTSASAEAPSRRRLRRPSKSIQPNRVFGSGRSTAGRKIRSFMPLVSRTQPKRVGQGVLPAYHERVGGELHVVLGHPHAHVEVVAANAQARDLVGSQRASGPRLDLVRAAQGLRGTVAQELLYPVPAIRQVGEQDL